MRSLIYRYVEAILAMQYRKRVNVSGNVYDAKRRGSVKIRVLLVWL